MTRSAKTEIPTPRLKCFVAPGCPALSEAAEESHCRLLGVRRLRPSGLRMNLRRSQPCATSFFPPEMKPNCTTLQQSGPPSPMFFVCIANTGVTGAIVVCMANAGVKVECFHTVEPHFVSADSAALKCYLVSYCSEDLRMDVRG